MKNARRVTILLVAIMLSIGLIGCEDVVEVPECTDTQELVNNECVDIVEDDTVAPVISGMADKAYTMGDPALDYGSGLTALDDVDGDITADIVVDASAVDVTTEGTYVVTITVEDAAGNQALESFSVVVTEAPPTDEDLAAIDIAAIDLDDNFVFPFLGANGSSFSWSTSHPDVITKAGYIIQPPIGADPVTVTITLDVTNGDYSTTVNYDYTVQPRDESVVTSTVTMPFTSTSDEYIVEDDSEVNIYFVDNGNVPFIDMEEFLLLVDGAVQSDILTFTEQNDDEFLISYDIEWEDFDGSFYTENYSALFDFTDNTLFVESYDFFESYVASTESDYGEGLNYTDADYLDSNEITIPLNDYRIDLVQYDDGTEIKYLIPFHVADLIFLGGIYYDVYYNGEELTGLDTFGISSGDSEVEQVAARTSSLNDAKAPKDVKEATYHFLALALDYFYGLKMDQGVDTYYDFLEPYADKLIMRTDSTMYKSVFEIANAMNDIHTSYVFGGYYADTDWADDTLVVDELADLGPRYQDFYNDIWATQDLIEAAGLDYDNLPSVRLIDEDKTAIIYLTGFSIDSPRDFKLTMEQLPATVENVVVDIAYNTGGNVGAVFRIFGYITEQTMQYHSMNPVDGSAVTYYIESSYVAYEQYNWFFTVSGVTFSAGNIMASMAKELGYPLIGQHTTGGASSIGVIMTPTGDTLLISTLSVSAKRVDGLYYSIEFGVEPDYEIIDMYDDDEILTVIEQHLALQNTN